MNSAAYTRQAMQASQRRPARHHVRVTCFCRFFSICPQVAYTPPEQRDGPVPGPPLDTSRFIDSIEIAVIPLRTFS